MVSKALWKDGEVCKMNIPKIKLTKQVNDFSKKVIQIKMGTFVSFLTSREVVEKVGLPIKNSLFGGMIWNIAKEFPKNFHLIWLQIVLCIMKLN